MPVTKYSEKPVIVDALKYDGANKQEVFTFGGGHITETGGKLYVDVVANADLGVEIEMGYWVTKDVAGILDVFNEDVFLMYYRPGGGP